MYSKFLAGIVVMTSLFLVCACQNVGSPLVSASKSPITESPLYEPGEMAEIPGIPTPSPTEGVVVGRLVTNNPNDRIGLSIFLGDVVMLGEKSHAAFLDRERAPIGDLNPATGWFVFVHVRPGIYALIVFEPEVGSWAYMTAEGDVMVIKVNPGEVTSLGDILFGR